MGKTRLISVAVALIAALIMACAAQGAPKKPVAKRTTVKKAPAKKAPAKKAPAKSVKAPTVSVPTGPTKLTVVAGQPFEAIPARGNSKMFITMCPEETAPATFAVSYSKSLAGVTVSAAGDFVGPGKIARTNIEVSRVDGDVLVNGASPVPSLVVAQAEIGSQPVQFWVNVTVPKGIKPGLYKGAIAFTVEGKVFDYAPLDVKVLPLRLIGSSKQYAVYTSLDPVADADGYTRNAAGFAKLGFRAVSTKTMPEDAASVFAAYKQAGLNSPVPLITYACEGAEPTWESVKSVESARRASGLTKSLYFCADVPSTEEQLTAAIAKAEVLRRARVEVVARLSDEEALARLEPYLDQMVNSVDMPSVQSLIAGESKYTGLKWQWYWWNARSSAWDNRIYSGIALWKSGLYGCMAAWMPDESETVAVGSSSVRGEALREGINDTRYLTTYMKALRELKDLKRQKDKDYIASTESYLAAFLAKPVGQLTPASLRDLRAKLVDFSIKLEARL